MANATTRNAPPRAENKGTKQGAKKQPVFVVRPGNGVSIAVYEDKMKTRDGESRTVYSVTTRKTYKTAENEWAHVYSLYPSDLLQAAWGLQKAYEWIVTQYQSQD